jgi:membrane-associated phospholipid phosphatase
MIRPATRLRRTLLAALMLSLAPGMPAAIGAQSDTIAARPLFTWRDGLLAGGFVGATLALFPFDKRTAAALQAPNRQQSHLLQQSAKWFRTIAEPGSVIIGVSLYGIGRLSKNERMTDLGLHGTEALFVGEGFGSVLKGTFGRARPYVDSIHPNPHDWQLFRGFSKPGGYRSFPSGHTVAAFAAAAAVTSETSRWWPGSVWAIAPAMYGGAGMVGLSRMYNNRHWASDVVLGAAIGTFAGTKVVRYHHSHPGNALDRWLLNVSLSPGARPSFSLQPVLGSSLRSLR